jgi:hypothetical protein
MSGEILCHFADGNRLLFLAARVKLLCLISPSRRTRRPEVALSGKILSLFLLHLILI